MSAMQHHFWEAMPGTPRREFDACQPYQVPAHHHPGMYASTKGRQPAAGSNYAGDKMTWNGQYHLKRQQMHEKSTMGPVGHDYGGAKVQKKTRMKKPTGQLFGMRGAYLDRHILIAVGVAVYLVTVCVFNFGSFRHAQATYGFVLCGLGAAFLNAFHHGRSLFWLAMSCCATVALFCGTAAGNYCYSNYGYYSTRYFNLRIYENVVPEESTAIVADAGRITFAQEAHLELGKASAFAADDGHMYCAAPVVGLEHGKIDFWAVGVDCCSLGGRFECGAAGDFEARSGVVMLPGTGGWFSRASIERYDDARRKSQALFNLKSGDNPIYVRWTKYEDLDGLEHRYKVKEYAFIGISTVCYLGISAILAKLMARKTPELMGPVPEI
eukprot:TRINITY_DN4601_c0_g1_i1.p1 TRINITY_DN4601_c0_g1~~TRINITY_DN4601_c0_g1_i1.p1  ORF type:complete len:382 (-),score=76.77 TRINITY_DN4601_c0_g1_i1:166-1311(-)